jgi:hypothetical protein
MENSFIADKAATKHISDKDLHRDYPINNVKLELENDHEIQPTRVDLVCWLETLKGTPLKVSGLIPSSDNFCGLVVS